MTELELIDHVQKYFGRFNDIVIHRAPLIGTIFPDFMLEYGGRPFAIIEVKTPKVTDDVKKQLHYYFDRIRDVSSNISSIYSYITNINGMYWYYDASKNTLPDVDIEVLLEELLKTIYKYADNGDSFIDDMRTLVDEHKDWGKYGKILLKYLKSGNLKTFGNHLFLKEEVEIAFMRDVLNSVNSESAELCKYTSVGSFYQTIKNGKFRLNDITVMNDALETRVIEQLPNLKSELSTVSSYINHGFIMCFSRNSTDKLMNWNMYGDYGKGVCYVINKVQAKDHFYMAPVVYVNKTRKHPILIFLNELSEQIMKKEFRFHLRLWHIWKYFFKYDYYEGEKEERLLYVTTNPGKEEWSEEYGTTRHVDKGTDDVPFKIKKVLLGPRCVRPKDTKDIFVKNGNHEFPVFYSKIKGYRG